MSFDTKYRPLRYGEVLGQKGTTAVLRQVVKNGTGFRQSYLFAGSHGTGKTTLGRILARALLCDSPQEGEPCDECPSCTRILETGQSEAFIEVDAATNSGKDNIRRVVEDSEYATFSGKQRIWLFDESHQLSRDALDGLLKPMEDNISGSLDKRLVCIFCTTEPEKMRTTVMSRSLNFQVKLVPPPEIASRLETICQEEGIVCEEGSLSLVAELTECHVRDAIKLVESIGQGGDITSEAVLRHLHLDKADRFLSLAEYLGTDLQACLREVAELIKLLPPKACYERLCEILKFAWAAGQGLGGTPAYLSKERLQALFERHQDALLWMSEYLAKRPARLTSALWSIDVALLHKRLEDPTFGWTAAPMQIVTPTIAVQRLPSKSPSINLQETPRLPAEAPAPVISTQVETSASIPVPAKKERDPMEPALGTVLKDSTKEESSEKVPSLRMDLESNLALASDMLRDCWICLEQKRNGKRSS